MKRSNLITLYNQATPQTITEGKQWYPSARLYFTQLARKYNRRPSVVCGIVAALSPFVNWTTQLAKTEDFIRAELKRKNSGRFPGFSYNLRNARRILANEAPLRVLVGPKTRAFYLNLIGRVQPITLDRHAISAYLGYKIGQHEKHTKAQLSTITNAYKAAAHSVQLGNCVFQAVIWNTWRNQK